jgi:fatty acid desaturase
MAWHSPPFKKEWGFLNNYLPWILGPLFGIPSALYVSHHIMMHHADDNLPVDRSSTMRFQRDSFVDFLRYMFRFMFAVSFDLVAYHRGKNRRKGVEKAIVGEGCMLVAIIALTVINWRASLFVAILPSLLMRFFMMVGNWGNHAFIDPKAPENLYRNSCNIINTFHNKRNFNDGYHIIHHVHSTLHWSELPAEFDSNIDVYAREDALVFERINYFAVWFLVVTRNLEKLATYVVHLPGGPKRSHAEIVTMLRERVQPIRITGQA